MAPLAISAAFIFTLYYYNWIFDNNIGGAFQITSMRLSKDKYRLISATLMILAVIYLFLAPRALSKSTTLIQITNIQKPNNT